MNEPLGIELELKLADFASINLHSGNAANRQHARFDGPVCNRSQCHERLFVGRKTNLHDPGRRGSERSHERWLHACREFARDCRQTFGHGLAVAIDVAAGTENNCDDGKTLDRPRTQSLDSGNAVDGILYGLSDQNLNLLWGKTGCLGLDGHLGRRELRESVVRHVGERKDTVAQEGTRERNRNTPETD